MELQSTKTKVAEAAATEETQNSETGKYVAPMAAPVFLEEPSKIYPFITEPHALQLGDPKHSIVQSGSTDYIIFYVLVDRDYIGDATGGTLTLSTDRGEHIRTYGLISYEEAANYNIQVPDAINGQPFMFAIVSLDNLQDHVNKLISLHSVINVSSLNTGSTESKLNKAFVYMP